VKATTLYDRLLTETQAARAEFLSIPVLKRAVDGDVTRPLYLLFLTQAYHHVRHTCPLLSLAAEKTSDTAYRAALHRYISEEQGHEAWILADIAALGGDAERATLSNPRPPCRAMIAYAYYAVERISPYALLGMVHVLEGSSVALATRAAEALQKAFGASDEGGFLYLKSHGALDADHTSFFRDVVGGLQAPSAGETIIDCAKMMYWLYGNIFRDLERDDGDARATRR
jgi:pyrroloquinoline quinone (PQQ) biosynthesis protein C